MAQLQCGSRSLDLSRPVVMGILNATPDSFSDGGLLHNGNAVCLTAALARAREMVAAGAQILDVGGESTRPGAEPVSLQQELERVVPLVELISAELDVVVSVDTSSPEVMLESARVGAGMINDVRALQRGGALRAAATTGLPVCLMHMQGEPQTMQGRPAYTSVLDDVRQFLLARVEAALVAGIARESILLDPGYGFGKTAEHNLQLLKYLPDLTVLGFPILAGLSRKSLIAHVLGRAVDQRLAASLALALMVVQNGAQIVRVHDVPETLDVLNMWSAVEASAR